MTTIPRALSRATNELDPVSDTPRLDAELLMAEALNIDRDRLILSPPGGDAPERFFAMIEWDPLESTCRHASLSIL